MRRGRGENAGGLKEHGKFVRRPYFDVASFPPALRFDQREIGALVPVWLAVVEVGERIESRREAGLLRQEFIRDAHDGRGIDAAAEFREQRPPARETPANGLAELAAEPFLELGVARSWRKARRFEFAVFMDGCADVLEAKVRSRRDRSNPAIGGQV